MPNARLTKDDGKILVLPASSIVAICTLVHDNGKPKDHEAALAMAFSTFRGFSVHFLSMTGKAAWEAVTDRDDIGREWIDLPANGDASYITPETVSAIEGIALTDGTDGLRVWFTRPDGQLSFTDVDHDGDKLELIASLIGGEQGDTEPARLMPDKQRKPK